MTVLTWISGGNIIKGVTDGPALFIVKEKSNGKKHSRAP
jgi:hypothetical protein